MKFTTSILAFAICGLFTATTTDAGKHKHKKPMRKTATDVYQGNSFFDKFDFFTAADPTHGFVNYVDAKTARSNNLTLVKNNIVYIYSDHKNVAPSNGRMSVRLSSKNTYDSGLFVFDILHMPVGCGTWPAVWTVGGSWPNNGEIDIVEGVNNQAQNAMTLHTNAGCTMAGVKRNQSGTTVTPNCDVKAPGQYANQGCGVTDTRTNSYGAGFNSNKGGVFVTKWSPSSGIQIWFFPRNNIPQDIIDGNPKPASWCLPNANFPFKSCPSSHFKGHQIVVDLTFCGDWAGNVFGQMCPGKGDCASYVKNNPSAFKQAYWAFRSFKVYQV
ncbi:concanavalin A-like lectin/glucanase domain-containing protein [Jimgerdemannia flammicorona]|uniref:Concanavalin A-like lectin/glucanase domain-containing protein n=1 Tax=Jimgerdemannia flammicorona TaxID=994334 RepID=A0A433QPJ3_9FUNG|nr:concanavalin A-like lectin/glucanase domain-containing protein [Jimgerdemannia flammicorona]